MIVSQVSPEGVRSSSTSVSGSFWPAILLLILFYGW